MDGLRSGLWAALFCPPAIGSIVLPMPEKTHGRAGRHGGRYERLLELLRGLVAERRVQAKAIIVLINELLDVSAQVIEILIVVGIDLFAFERLYKALTTGVVVRVRRPTHARNHLVLFQHLHVFIRRILHSAIGVMH